VTRFEVGCVHAANVATCLTGLIYAYLRYLAKPLDEFALLHPGVAPAQHAHLLAAPLLVFAIGLIWTSHVLPGLRAPGPSRRRSGIALVSLAGPMIVSGYLLQVATEPGARTLAVATHLIASALWLASAVAHQVVARRR
jgi:hypothetical protein